MLTIIQKLIRNWKFPFILSFSILCTVFFFHCNDNNKVITDIAINVIPSTDSNRNQRTFFIGENISVCLEVLEIKPIDSLVFGIVNPASNFTYAAIKAAADTTLTKGNITIKNYVSIRFDKPGLYLLGAYARSSANEIAIDSTYVTVVEENGKNTAPAVQLKALRDYAAPSLPCSLKVTLTNTEPWQTVSFLKDSMDKNITIVNDSLCIWTPTVLDTSMLHEVKVFAIDNGLPPISAFAGVIITVLKDGQLFSEPQNLRVVGQTPGLVQLSWDSVKLADKYRVYRSKTMSFDSAKIFETNNTTLTDTTDSTFFYRVETVNYFGVSKNGSVIAGRETAPTVEKQTANITRCFGENAIMSVAVCGAIPFSYQWFKAGLKIEGATSCSLSVASATAQDAGVYECLISNSIGNVKSSPITLAMTSPSTKPDSITASASNICPGTPVILSINGGTLGAGAQWSWYAGSISGSPIGSGPSLTVSPAVTTVYYARAEGGCNISDSAGVLVNVKTESKKPTEISADKPMICLNDSAVLSVSGGSLGTGAAWEWYSGSPTGGNYLGIGPSIVVKPTVTTVYSLRGRGDCNTTDWTSLTVVLATESTAPLTATASVPIICQGDSTTLTASGGSLGIGANLHWYADSCGSTKAVGIGNIITVKPNATTLYFARAEGICNITTCASVAVAVDSVSIAPGGINAPESVCPSALTKITVKGGKLGTEAKWVWYSGSCTGTPIGSGDSIKISQTVPTTYFVRAEGKCNITECAKIEIGLKTKSDITNAIAATTSQTICPGKASTLTIVGGSLGTGAQWYWYAVNPNVNTTTSPIGSGTSVTVSPTTSTTYYVRANGDCGYTECKNIAVAVRTISTAPSSHSEKICATSTSAAVYVSGGVLGTDAKWVWYSDASCTNYLSSGISRILNYPFKTVYVRAEGPCGDKTAIASVSVIRDSSLCHGKDSVSSWRTSKILSKPYQIHEF